MNRRLTWGRITGMASTDLDPYLARVLYGRIVRDARTAAGLDQAEAAELTGIPTERLGNIEQARTSTSEEETSGFVQHYRIPDDTAAELRSLVEPASGKGQSTGSPGRGRRFSVLERAASEIKAVYPYVPGMFQTAEYALAQIRRSPLVPTAQADSRAETRRKRGDALMRRTDCQVITIIGEEALHRQVGGPEVLKRQLERLLRFANLDHVTVRLFPYTAGDTSGLANPFTLLFVDVVDLRLAYVETLTGSAFVKKLGAHVAAFEDAQERALPDGDSRALLEKRIDDL